MKKLIFLTALVLCFCVSFINLGGCAKKKTETKTEEVKEAPGDTTQSALEDTTVSKK
ncbi:MAG: hypothetical protein ABIL68_05285 [bacterium]